MGIELDKAFNAHKDKAREEQEVCEWYVLMKLHRTIEGWNGNLHKRIPGNPVRGTTWHNNH